MRFVGEGCKINTIIMFDVEVYFSGGQRAMRRTWKLRMEPIVYADDRPFDLLPRYTMRPLLVEILLARNSRGRGPPLSCQLLAFLHFDMSIVRCYSGIVEMSPIRCDSAGTRMQIHTIYFIVTQIATIKQPFIQLLACSTHFTIITDFLLFSSLYRETMPKQWKYCVMKSWNFFKTVSCWSNFWCWRW